MGWAGEACWSDAWIWIDGAEWVAFEGCAEIFASMLWTTSEYFSGSTKINFRLVGQLDDYYIMDEVTIYFANGNTKVDTKHISQITTLAQNASKVEGYGIEIKGYASVVGSRR